jgi:hypothetical protein
MIDRRHFLIGTGALLTASSSAAFAKGWRAVDLAFRAQAGRDALRIHAGLRVRRKTTRSPNTARGGASRSGPISRSRRRLRLGVSICVRSDIPSTRRTRSSARA